MKRFAGWLAVVVLGVCAGCGAGTTVSAGSPGGAPTGPNPTSPPTGSSGEAGAIRQPTQMSMGSPASEATTPRSTTATPVGSTGSGSADPADLELAAELFDLAGVDVVPGVKVEARRVAVTSAAATDWATGFGYTPTQATVTGTSIVVTVLLNRERQCWIGKESPGVSATLFEAGCGPKLMALFVFP